MSGHKHIPRWTSQHSEGAESVSDELELLMNVYLEDMEVKKETERTVLKFHVKPSTGDDEDKQFVWLDLQFLLGKGYPHSKPGVTILQSRGLSDAHLRSILEDLNHLSGEKLGTPMVFDLVEHARGCLTDNNKPCGHCAMCQFTMEEDDVFVRTPCYHCFHQSCMAQYIHFFRQEQQQEQSCSTAAAQVNAPKKLECPVCREPIPDIDTCVVGMENVSLAPDGSVGDFFRFEVTDELRAWQMNMAAMLRRQCERGGTINPAQEVVIDDTWVSIPAVKGEPQAGIPLSKPEESRHNSVDTRQMRRDVREYRQNQGNLEGSGELLDSRQEQQQDQSEGGNTKRVCCPPGFSNVHRGCEGSKTGYDSGQRSRGHDDSGQRSRGHDDSGQRSRGHDDSGQRSRGHDDSRQRSRGHDSGQRSRGHDDSGQRSSHGSRYLGYKEHSRSHVDRKKAGSHGDREHGRQGTQQHTAGYVIQDGQQQNVHVGATELDVRQASSKGEEQPQEAGITQRRDGMGLYVTKVTRQAAEPRDHARPHQHNDSRRVLRYQPKKASGGKAQPIVSDEGSTTAPPHTIEHLQARDEDL